MDVIEWSRFLLKSIGRRKKLATERVPHVFEIDFNSLQKQGVKLLIFDVDDTLTDHRGIFTKETELLLGALAKAFIVCLYSNADQKRKKQLEEMVRDYNGIQVEQGKSKPNKQGFLTILKRNGILPEQAAMIGDRPGTDLWGAYIAGIHHRILVEPYSLTDGGKKAPFPLRMLRWFEKKLTD